MSLTCHCSATELQQNDNVSYVDRMGEGSLTKRTRFIVFHAHILCPERQAVGFQLHKHSGQQCLGRQYKKDLKIIQALPR